MNFRVLRVGQMVAVARHLTGPARAALEALPGGERFVAQLEGFLELVTAPGVSQARQIAELDALLAGLDGLHDRLLRGLFLLTGGLAEVADDPAETAAWRALQQRLLPEGLAGVNRTYLEQAATAEFVRRRLEAGDAERLASIALPGGQSLDSLVTRWAETGQALRERDNERSELRAADKRLSLATLGEARRTFSRVVNHLVSTLDFHGAEPAVRERLLSKLQEAIAVGEERQRRQRAAGVETVDEEEVVPLVVDAEATPA